MPWLLPSLALPALAGASVDGGVAVPEAPPQSGPAELEADHVEVQGDVASGTGHVRLTFGDDVVTGDAFTVDLAKHVATVTNGTWTHAGATLTFSSAELDLVGKSGTVTGATFDDGPLHVTGDLGLRADGVLVGDHVTLTTCDCAKPPPWTVHADHVEVVPGDVVRFRGALIAPLDVPLLPVPFGAVPLKRRSGLLAPVLAYGVDGLRVAEPVYVTLGKPADMTLTPEVRTERSARLLGEGRWAFPGGGGLVETAGGWDWQEDRLRGAIDWDHASDGEVMLATEGRVTSDLEYSEDYGDSYFSRQVPWNESRALVGVGPVEVAADGFQRKLKRLDEGVLPQRSADVRAWMPARDVRGFLVAADAGVGADVLAGYEDTVTTHLQTLSADGDLSLSRPTRVGPFVVTPRADGHAVQPMGGVPSATGDVSAALRVPFWRDVRGGVERVDVDGLVGVTSSAATYRAGAVTFRHLAKTTFEARAAVFDAGNLSWHGDGWLSGGPWYGWAQADGDGDVLELADAGIGWDDGTVHLDVAGLHADASRVRQDDADVAEDLDQARGTVGWTLPGKASVFRIGGGLAYDVGSDTWTTRWASVRYLHPTGCLGLGATARFDVDRPLPDVALDVRVTPR